MNESNVSPGSEGPVVPPLHLPRPTALGTAFLLAALTSLFLGILRGELAAILWGSTILIMQAYAFLAVAFAAALRRTALRGYACLIEPLECNQGDRVIANAKGVASFRPPLVLVRYRIDLKTVDGRETVVCCDPERSRTSTFTAGARGAYFASRDKLELIDTFAFFRASFEIPAEPGARLLVRPAPDAAETRLPKFSGGIELRTERTFRRTEDLTDNRRYTPGDDPRRINWKIYGHAGELFVREGEPEPPPRSRFVILVDVSTDPQLFDPELGQRAVDALAQKALGLANAVIAAGYEARFGFNGSEVLSGSARAAATAFAYPAALALDAAPPLPRLAQTDGGTVVLALPRRVDLPSALENFLRGPRQESQTEILFVAPAVEDTRLQRGLRRFLFRPREDAIRPSSDSVAMDRAVRECIAAYGGRRGVHARNAAT